MISRTLALKPILYLVFLFGLSSIQGSQFPNIIIIFADDLGYGDLSCFGSETIQTPNLDSLAKEGQKWTQFYSASPICSPSRAALMTGLYPFRTGTDSQVFYEWSAGGLIPESHTIAELLKDYNYRTACIGKWHLGHTEEYLPEKHGFDYFYGIPYSNDMRVDPKMKVSDSINFRKGMNLEKMRSKGNKIKNWVPLMESDLIIEYPCDQETLTKRYTEKSIQFIQSNQRKPFFLYLSHTMPHIPLMASEKFKGISQHGPYGDAIEEIDHSVGLIIKTLKSLNIEKNTLIIFTSDNGPDLTYNRNPGSTGNLQGSKFYPSEGGQRVPAIFWWPETIEPAVINQLGSTLDIYSTIKNLLPKSNNVETPCDSYDLSKVLLQNELSKRDHFFYLSTGIPPRAQVYAIRKGNWKAHFYKSNPPFYDPNKIIKLDPVKLYNLHSDPTESNDLAQQHPEIINELLGLKSLFDETAKPAFDQSIPKLEDQIRPSWAQ